MIGPFDVEWTNLALDDWKQLSFADAKAISVAVRRGSQ
jgi:hypothetical protein